MIETASIRTGLVYIHSGPPSCKFVACGALIEGGYIATCRHVWCDAIDSEDGETGESSNVVIEFPFAHGQEPSTAYTATLADDCKGLDAQAPDLVLLKPDGIPHGMMKLQLAAEADYEIGPGKCHCYLKTQSIDDFICGEIDGTINAKGMRKFTGDKSQDHFVEDGSSGSPVFRLGGQQLAGIVSLAYPGANKGTTHLRVAFVVPATTIHKYLRALIARLAANVQAEKRGVDPASLQPILAKLGQMDVPDDKIAERLEASVEDILAQAAKQVPASNDEADIEDAIKASREKLGALDMAGALEVLQAKIAGEEHKRACRLVPLLKERAAVERLAFDYEAAKKTFAEVTGLAANDVWAFIGLGDLYWITGPLKEAAKAFRNAAEAARRRGDESFGVVQQARRRANGAGRP